MSDNKQPCAQHNLLQDSVTHMKETLEGIASDVAYTRGQVDMVVKEYSPRISALESSYRRQNWALIAIVMGALLKSALKI